MSNNDEDEITKIEDLKDIVLEEDEDFTDLDSMAENMGLASDSEDKTQVVSLSDLDGFPEVPEDFPSTQSSDETEDELLTSSDNNFDSYDGDDQNSEVENHEDDFGQFDSFDSGTSTDLVNGFFTEESSQQELPNDSDEQEELGSIETPSAIVQEEVLQTPERTDELSTSSSLVPEASLNIISETTEAASENKTPIEPQKITETNSTENFNEVEQFATDMSFGDFAAEGNPPFSIIIKNAKYYEDVDSICEILLESKVVDEQNLTQLKQKLEQSQLLIPRLSEYAAIILCHKLRAFDIEILMGLTEEINPPKSYQSNDKGLTNKNTFYANKKSHHNFNQQYIEQDVLVSTLDKIEGHIIRDYLGVITSVKNVPQQEIFNAELEDQIINNLDHEEKTQIEAMRLERENHIAAKSEYHDMAHFLATHPDMNKKHKGLTHIYNDLINDLMLEAKSKSANGIVGVNFSINPIGMDNYLRGQSIYQILCSGNMVWLEKN